MVALNEEKIKKYRQVRDLKNCKHWNTIVFNLLLHWEKKLFNHIQNWAMTLNMYVIKFFLWSQGAKKGPKVRVGQMKIKTLYVFSCSINYRIEL